jgi:glycerophosphoryl diester phosphodiesterase
MEKTLAAFVAVAVVLFLGFGLCAATPLHDSPQDSTVPFIAVPRYIAHAGGGIAGMSYTNSLEAFNANFGRGHRFFEMDLSWTSDDQLVLIHDWEGLFPSLFRQRKDVGVPTLDEFLRLRMRGKLTPLSFAELADWLHAHTGAKIITDVKEDNLRALRRISDEFPDLVGRIIPQIYTFEEFKAAWNMGYRNIILTLYVKEYPDEAVLNFAQSHRLFGVTMRAERARGPLPKLLRTARTPVFAHTVNSQAEERELKANGVSGVYTDFLSGER